MDFGNSMKARKSIDTLCKVIDTVTEDNDVIKQNMSIPVSNLFRMELLKYLLCMVKNIDDISDEEFEYLNWVFGVDRNTLSNIYYSPDFSWTSFVYEIPLTLQIISVVERTFLFLAYSMGEDIESLQSQILQTYKLLGYDYLKLQTQDCLHKEYVFDLYIKNLSNWVKNNNNNL